MSVVVQNYGACPKKHDDDFLVWELNAVSCTLCHTRQQYGPCMQNPHCCDGFLEYRADKNWSRYEIPGTTIWRRLQCPKCNACTGTPDKPYLTGSWHNIDTLRKNLQFVDEQI